MNSRDRRFCEAETRGLKPACFEFVPVSAGAIHSHVLTPGAGSAAAITKASVPAILIMVLERESESQLNFTHGLGIANRSECQGRQCRIRPIEIDEIQRIRRLDPELHSYLF